MYAVFQSENRKTARKIGTTRFFTESGDSIPVTVVEIESKNANVVTIGHVDFYKDALCNAMSNGKQGSNKSDRKRDRKNRWR